MFIEILFKILLFKGGVLIHAEHCIIIIYNINICNFKYNFIHSCLPTFLFIYNFFFKVASTGSEGPLKKNA